ncbi:DUF5615 family PIN-like protein [Roseivirga sp.]|uniref:DUF5615 family PIN-like protein n=1 Tax=Roseivirga sp. TaxID=1964215 RepID=UPI003B52D78E
MKFLANENFTAASVNQLKSNGIDVVWITEISPGISDHEIMNFAINENRIILTHDGDYGELIFKHHYRPPGVIYFRLTQFAPAEPSIILTNLIEEEYDFKNRLTVIDSDSIRERKFS